MLFNSNTIKLNFKFNYSQIKCLSLVPTTIIVDYMPLLHSICDARDWRQKLK